jgi:hypothetical protein
MGSVAMAMVACPRTTFGWYQARVKTLFFSPWRHTHGLRLSALQVWNDNRLAAESSIEAPLARQPKPIAHLRQMRLAPAWNRFCASIGKTRHRKQTPKEALIGRLPLEVLPECSCPLQERVRHRRWLEQRVLLELGFVQR